MEPQSPRRTEPEGESSHAYPWRCRGVEETSMALVFGMAFLLLYILLLFLSCTLDMVGCSCNGQDRTELQLAKCYVPLVISAHQLLTLKEPAPIHAVAHKKCLF